jgi:hypothetical protein
MGVTNSFLSESVFESDQTLLSKDEICPMIFYQTIELLPFMTTLIFYQTIFLSYTFSINNLK